MPHGGTAGEGTGGSETSSFLLSAFSARHWPARAEGLIDPLRRARAGSLYLHQHDVSELVADLNRTRKRGYAISNEEAEQGVAAVAVAIRAPGGGVVGTTSVAGPVIRVTPGRYESIAQALNATAADLSLGWPGAAGRPGRVRKARA